MTQEQKRKKKTGRRTPIFLTGLTREVASVFIRLSARKWLNLSITRQVRLAMLRPFSWATSKSYKCAIFSCLTFSSKLKLKSLRVKRQIWTSLDSGILVTNLFRPKLELRCAETSRTRFWISQKSSIVENKICFPPLMHWKDFRTFEFIKNWN